MDPSAVLTLLIFAYLIKVASSFHMVMWRPNCWKQTSVRSSIFQWACKSEESLVLKLWWLIYFCTVHNKSWKEIFSCMRTILLISNYWEEMKCGTNSCIEWLHTKWDGYFNALKCWQGTWQGILDCFHCFLDPPLWPSWSQAPRTAWWQCGCATWIHAGKRWIPSHLGVSSRYRAKGWMLDGTLIITTRFLGLQFSFFLNWLKGLCKLSVLAAVTGLIW